MLLSNTAWLSIELKSVYYYIVVTQKNQVVLLLGVLTSILSNTYADRTHRKYKV